MSPIEALSGSTTTLSGGTRATIRLGRPWQDPLESLIDPSSCPFCAPEQQQQLALDGLNPEWRLLPNTATPHPNHALLVPSRCWPATSLRELGGEPRVVAALQGIALVAAKRNHEVASFIHVGRSAGQNLGHPHWHILETKPAYPFARSVADPKRLIDGSPEAERFFVIASGARAGECLIVPNARRRFGIDDAESLALVVFWLVRLANRAFRSQEGMTPDFIVTVRIGGDGVLRYADYCPILNQWGAPEYVIAPLESGSITLPWPHELTATFLRQASGPVTNH